jgi:quercetin dioxygenase-like cupin family protein
MFVNHKRNDTIEDLKMQRAVAMENFNAINLIKNEKLAEFFFTKFQEGEDVPFSVLDSTPVGKDFILPVIYGGAIVTTKLKDNSDNIIIYETRWTAGSTLTWHFHSDCTETVIVREGVIKVYVQGSVHVLGLGQKLEIAAGVGHQITALKTSVLDIKFLKI